MEPRKEQKNARHQVWQGRWIMMTEEREQGGGEGCDGQPIREEDRNTGDNGAKKLISTSNPLCTPGTPPAGYPVPRSSGRGGGKG